MSKNSSTNKNELAPYLAAGMQLIPLHRHDHTDVHHGRSRERGKSPIDMNWTKRRYDSAAMAAHMEAGNNVGVRLRAEDLVVDVDPRNGGTESLRRLLDDLGLDLGAYPAVDTGSGGQHLYMSKPADVPIRDSLPDYMGVEFKSRGRQVVAAGSIHPNGRRYEWDFTAQQLGADGAPAAPARLLAMVRRPQATAARGGGEHDQEEVAAMLDALDPVKYRDHDRWLELMMACHHASGGDARSEFVEWSTRDPDYADRGAEVGRRWDSLHADNSAGRITHRTLYKRLADAGKADAIPRRAPEDDFADEVEVPPDDPDAPDHERLGPLERMNLQYCCVVEGNRFRVMFEQEDPSMGRTTWARLTERDFCSMLRKRKVQRGDKTVRLADAWLDWGGRRTAEGVVFDPEKQHPGFLNLWTGWGVEPRRGADWSLLQELIEDMVCDRDAEAARYVYDWCAHLVQHPGSPAEVALCMQGKKGTGKSTFGRALTSLAGRHGMQVGSAAQLTGRFNSHLRDVVVLFADEAVRPGDREAESRLKVLITEPVLAYEAKGRDVETGPNRLHVVMASNDEWFVPAGMEGERRFFITRVSDRRAKDAAFFRALHRQLHRDGGLGGLLWDMLNRQLPDGWAPREGVPATRASVDQKIRNMTPVQQWIFNHLDSGEPLAETPDDWEQGPIRVAGLDLKDSFDRFCRSSGIRAGSNNRSIDRAFVAEVRQCIPGMSKKRVWVPLAEDRVEMGEGNADGRIGGFRIPSLRECREDMARILGGDPWCTSTADADFDPAF